MYELASLERSSIHAGSSLLLVGRDAGGARERLLEALAEGSDGPDGGASDDSGRGPDAVLLVSTAATAEAVDGLFARGVPGDRLGVVDASGAGLAVDGVAESARVAGPGDLPAVGVDASDRIDRLGHRYDRVRVGLDSVTGLLAARELPAVFRFLHVLVGRIRSVDALLLATVDGSAHEEGTLRTLAELFDETIELE